MFEKVPVNIQKRCQEYIEILDYENPRDPHWRQLYKNFTKNYMTGVSSSNSHAWSGSWSSETTEWKTAMSEDLKVNGGMKSMREYGENSVHEDFADSIGCYSTQNAWFRKNFSNREKIIDDKLK